MSEYDAATYERFSNAVRRQVQSLRIILDNLQVSFTLLSTTLFILNMIVCLDEYTIFNTVEQGTVQGQALQSLTLHS